MPPTPAAAPIAAALDAVERAVERIVDLTRAEQQAPADRLPAVVAEKLQALGTINTSYRELRQALDGREFGGSLQRLAERAHDPLLRQRAAELLRAVTRARAENAISRKLIQSKLNFVRVVAAAVDAARDADTLSSALPAAPFGPGAGRRRSLGRA